jgi:hypothetical protein
MENDIRSDCGQNFKIVEIRLIMHTATIISIIIFNRGIILTKTFLLVMIMQSNQIFCSLCFRKCKHEMYEREDEERGGRGG